MRLAGKVAIITGAGRGIGREAALLFAREGAKVVLADVDPQAEKVVGEIKEFRGEAIFVRSDVTNRESCVAMTAAAVSSFGRIDILVNNAGITRDAQLLKLSESDFDRVIAVNLKGTFNATQAVAPQMVDQGSGRIINVSSVVGLYGNFGQTNYAATKAGVIGMTKTWARELGRKGITVNAVAPGFIQTEMTESVPEKVLELMRGRTPLGRLGTARDVANIYLFLASDDAAYVNGTVVCVDGGLIP
ncbi:MAG: 3-oxoacyl-ACP reductase FabG [Candidatus Bipolaricaulota bacterium]|nr:3-oxoacyl-ACP reductase FabG [Candidatus Bipolaricaulota bacterium]